METVDISLYSLVLALSLLVIPVVLSWICGLKLAGPLLMSTARMSVQLALIGIFLKFLFKWNQPVLNVLWLTVMILTAVVSAVRDSSMRVRTILVPVFTSFSLATFLIVLFINIFVIRLDRVFDARYLVVLGGMLLGNSLRGNIIGITAFYQNIKKDSKIFLSTLSLGASFREAVLPYLQESVRLALKPTIAAMATMGIVALPGMMTGVILGGTSPDVAVKYQIMIMIAIVVSTVSSVFLTIVMTMKSCFTPYGILKTDIFTASV